MRAVRDSEKIALLGDLVREYSPSGKEDRACQVMEKALTNLGWRAHRDKARNVVGSLGEGPYHIMLLGHIDTVPGELDVRCDGKALYGRGTVDAKGPLAALVWGGYQALLRPSVASQITITLVAAVEEETPASSGAHHIVRGPKPHSVVVGEPSGQSSITLGYKGCLRVSLIFHGEMSHSAGPCSAAAERAFDFWKRFSSRCRTLWPADRAFDQVSPHLLSFSSEQDGLSQAATLEVAVRLPPGVLPDEVVAEIEQVCGHASVAVHGQLPAHLGGRSNALVSSFSSSIRKLGARPRFTVKTGTSDMNVVGPKWGCPVLAYGPGDPKLSHTPVEHLDLDEYLKAIQVVEQALVLMAQRKVQAS